MPGSLRAVRAPLLRWYARHRRDLPWRRTRDPYAIWVSEVMLQQTQVKTVLPYYDRFLRRFPDVAALAAAGEEEVLAAWSGLGYYRRARALHAGARRVVQRHGGRLPRDPALLRELPGVGRYTAGAVSSIAFDAAEPVLDGNVRRVLARLLATDGERLGRAREEKLLWSVAADLVRGARPGDLNQALMELGALTCTPVSPDCGRCPARRWCKAHAEGDPERYPARRPPPATRSMRVAVAWIRRGDRVLLERPGPASPLRGTWDLPAVEIVGDGPAADPLRERFRSAGLDLAGGRPLAVVGHGIMNRRLRLEIVACRILGGRVSGRRDLRWAGNLDEIAVSGVTHKVARRVGAGTALRSEAP